jgi:peptide/nickel transport system substrate-binding protein
VPDAVATFRVDYASQFRDEQVWGVRNYTNPTLDAAFEKYLAATSDEMLTVARKEIQRLLLEDLPTIPIIYRDFGTAVSNEIDPASVIVDPLEFSFWIDRIRWAK